MSATLLDTEQDRSASQDLESLREQLRALESQRPESPAHEIDWRLVVDTSNDAFLAADTAGALIEWNSKAEELFGWTREEALGRTLEETILPPNERVCDRGGLQCLTVTEEGGKRLELTARRRDGSELPAEVSVSTMRRGASFVFNVFVHDITARRELQTQLTHAQKLESIGQLSAGIAHEINTPTQYVGDNTRFVQEALEDLLNVLAKHRELADAVRGGAEPAEALRAADAAAEEADLDYLKEELGAAVEQSLEGVDRVARIVRAMKEFSHPGVAAKTPTHINAAIQNTITVATNEWKYVAEIETDFDESLPPVPCLPGDFNQVILNMIVNSAHAIRDKLGEGSSEKGVITIATRRWRGEEPADKPRLEITVTDSGAGIPEEIVGRVFDPFFTTKDVGVGTGQGLAIARNVIVDKHDGTIEVDTRPGEGTTFTIRIPLES